MCDMTFYRQSNYNKSVANNTMYPAYMGELNGREEDILSSSHTSSSSSLSTDHAYTSPPVTRTSHRLHQKHELKKKHTNGSRLSYHTQPKNTLTNAFQDGPALSCYEHSREPSMMYHDHGHSFYSAPPRIQKTRENIKTRNHQDILTMSDDLYDDHSIREPFPHDRKKSPFRHKFHQNTNDPDSQNYFKKNMNDIMCPKIGKMQSSSNNFLRHLSESELSDTSSSFLSDSMDENENNIYSDDQNYMEQGLVHTPKPPNKNVVDPHVHDHINHRLSNHFHHDNDNDSNEDAMSHTSSSFSLSASPVLHSSSSSSTLSSIHSSDLEDSLSISLSDFSDMEDMDSSRHLSFNDKHTFQTHVDDDFINNDAAHHVDLHRKNTERTINVQKPHEKHNFSRHIHQNQSNIYPMVHGTNNLVHQRHLNIQPSNDNVCGKSNAGIPKVGPRIHTSNTLFDSDEEDDDDNMSSYSDHTDSSLSSDVSFPVMKITPLPTQKYMQPKKKDPQTFSDDNLVLKSHTSSTLDLQDTEQVNTLTNLNDHLLNSFNSNITTDVYDNDKKKTTEQIRDANKKMTTKKNTNKQDERNEKKEDDSDDDDDKEEDEYGDNPYVKETSLYDYGMPERVDVSKYENISLDQKISGIDETLLEFFKLFTNTQYVDPDKDLNTGTSFTPLRHLFRKVYLGHCNIGVVNPKNTSNTVTIPSTSNS